MKKQGTSRNVRMVVIQVVVSGIALFVLYRYLLETVGVVLLGVWSVVVATVSASRVTELGLSGSVVKFVSKYLARSEPERAAGVIETVCISIGVLVGVVLVVVYPLIAWVLGYFIPEENMGDALSILPYALFSLWLMAIAETFQAGLDGCQRFDLRSIIMIAGSLTYLGMATIFVPQYGLKGVVFGQICQAALLLLAGWFLLRRQLKTLSLFPHRWSLPLFREMLGYGVNFQIIGIIQFLIDPATKMLLSRFGGLAGVGYYEMANRMVMQVWRLLVMVNQTTVPKVAAMKELEPGRIREMYEKTYDAVLFVNLPFYAAVTASLPVISKVWLGYYEPTFVYMGFLLLAGRFCNAMSGPSFFTYLGTGRLRWNTLDYVSTGILNIVLGYYLGAWIGDIGVVIGAVIALIVGSSIPVCAYHIENKVPFERLLPGETHMLTVACIYGTVLALIIYYSLHGRLSDAVVFSLGLSVFTAVILPSFWAHDMRAELMRVFVYSGSGLKAGKQ